MAYSKAQSFFLDPEIFNNASLVFLTSVDLYFKNKPGLGTGSSGIYAPGVTVGICPLKDGKPVIEQVGVKSIARNDYGTIASTTDASYSTNFKFSIPVPLQTGNEYAVVIAFDDPDFRLWTNKSGEEDISTGQTAKNSSGKTDGNMFDITNGNVITPVVDTDLKFALKFAKFSETSRTFKIVNEAYEFIKLSSGSLNGAFIGGEYVYVQQANAIGTVTVSSGGSNVTGTSTDFGNTTSSSFTDKISNNDLILVANSSTSQIRKVNVVTNTTFLNTTSSFATSMSGVNIRTFEKGSLSVNTTSYIVIGTNTAFDSVLSIGDHIVLTDGTDSNTVVRQVTYVTNSSSITLDVIPPFTNTNVGYYKSVVGKVDKFANYKDMLVLYESSANSTLYFTNNKIIKGVDSTAKAISYSLIDVSLAKYTPRYRVAVPAGTRFNQYVNVANSSYYTIAAKNKQVLNDVSNIIDNYSATIASRSNEVLNPSNLFANAKSLNANLQLITDNDYTSPYVVETNLDFSTEEFLINNDTTAETYGNNRFASATFNSNVAVASTNNFITVASNPFVNNDVLKYVTSPGNNVVTGLVNNQSYFVVSANTTGIKLSSTEGGVPIDITATIYSETGHTLKRDGVAFSKYVSKQVTLDVDQIAEDLIVYMSAFKPIGTDIEVYVKLISEEDGESFNTKNWTKMELNVPTGSKVISIDSNPDDFVDLEFNIPGYHTGSQVTSGTFTTTLSSAVITGSYSTVNTDIVSGQLVRVYNPNFPSTYFVDTVTSSNTTTFNISKAISNSSLVSSGLKVDVITNKNSAYLDNQNYNIVRYYNGSMAKYDGYKTFSIKIVLKSDNYYLVPRVAEYRAIAVSA